jgi:long-chain acyl-CoA synthetase
VLGSRAAGGKFATFKNQIIKMEHYFSILEQTIKRDWDRPALCNYKGETISFCQMAENIEKFHLFFQEAGIKKGEKIALSAKNTARWANTFLAINTYETVVVPILSDFTPEAICNLTNHSEARILFTDKEIWEKMDLALMPNVIAVVDNSDYTLRQQGRTGRFRQHRRQLQEEIPSWIQP